MDLNLDVVKSLREGLGELYSDLAEQKLQAYKVLEIAEKHGLDPQDISDIVKVCTRHDLNPRVAGLLVKSLIPRNYVPEDAVICALSRICSGKFPLQIQKSILEWITHKFHAIYPKSHLHSLYGMIFNILDNDFLCAPACHLLCLMTRVEDISYFRIYQLAQCQRRAGNSPHIRALLKLMQTHAQRSAIGGCSCTLRIEKKKMWSSLSVGAPSKYGVLFKESNRRLLEQRQHMIAISPEEDITPHLEFWLQHHLSRLLESALEQIDTPDMLKSMFISKNYLRKTFNIWGAFLYDFLETWNGCDHCDMVLNFIANIPLPYFINLRDKLFEVLKKVFVISESLMFKLKVIDKFLELTCKYIPNCVEIAEKSRFSPVLLVKDLIRFVEDMALEHSLLNENDCAILHAVFEYWDVVSSSLLSNKVDIAIVPHFYYIYKALFGISSAYLSSMCETLHRLLLISHSNCTTKSHKNLNSQVLEIYEVLCLHNAESLLRKRGFIIQSATFTERIDENLEGDCTKFSSKTCFCLQKHPGLMTYVAEYMGRNRKHSDTANEDGVVKYLKSEEVVGVANFLEEVAKQPGTMPSCSGLDQ